MIQGSKTKIHTPEGVAVDPVRNLMVVASYSYRERSSSILIFNRTDQGNVAPRAIISGPKTGIILFRQIEVDPERGKIYVAVKNNTDSYNPKAATPSPWNPNLPGFIGVWDITDSGDVPPKRIIKGPATGLMWPAGVALNPKDREVFVVDSVSNGLSTFSVPEFFEKK
jgi:DNA-binding beta-propeller fold protein YncE